MPLKGLDQEVQTAASALGERWEVAGRREGRKEGKGEGMKEGREGRGREEGREGGKREEGRGTYARTRKYRC